MDDIVFSKMPADVHHEIGLECIDCHSSYELMGDGRLYYHKEEAVKIQCSDCHNKEFSTVEYEELDTETSGTALNLSGLKTSSLSDYYDSDGAVHIQFYQTADNGDAVDVDFMQVQFAAGVVADVQFSYGSAIGPQMYHYFRMRNP